MFELVELALKLYALFWYWVGKIIWRIALFIIFVPLSPKYRRFALEYYRPLFKILLRFGFILSALFIVGVIIFVVVSGKNPTILATIFILGIPAILFVISLIYNLVSFGKWLKKTITDKTYLRNQLNLFKDKVENKLVKGGFTILELVIATSIGLTITMGTIGFLKTQNAIKISNQIGREFQRIYEASCKMDTTNFTIDDLVAKGLIPTKRSVIGRDYTLTTDGKTITITLTLPSKAIYVKGFPYPLQYYQFLNSRWVSATYVLPYKNHRLIADKNWYGF
jgi:hypothetical protein